jgi:hypothetical protein
MKQNISIIITLLLCLALSSGCSKSSSSSSTTVTTTTDNTQYILQNNTNKPITVDAYKYMSDVYTDANMVARIVVPANNKIFTDKLKNGTIYYLDWYSADYTYNNWYLNINGMNSSLPELNSLYQPGVLKNGSFVINHYGSDISRYILLNGSGTSSKWHAVGMVDVAWWNGLKDYQKFVELEVKKDFTVSLSMKDTTFNTYSIPAQLAVTSHYTTAGQEYMQAGFSVWGNTQIIYCKPDSVLGSGYIYSHDRITLKILNGNEYVMERE